MQPVFRVLFSLPFLLFCLLVNGQRKVNLDSVSADWSALRGFYSVGGQPIGAVKFSRLTDGSPFYIKNWHKADLLLQDGGQVKDITMKLNLLDNQIHFLADDVEMVAIKPVREVKINSPLDQSFQLFRNGFPPTSTTTQNTYFEVLVEGNATLVKHIRKQMFENKPYGSATTEQQIRDKINYYLYKDKILHRLKNYKQDLLPLLADHKTSVNDLLSKNNMNLKNEEDLHILITYYNNLSPMLNTAEK